MNNVTKLVVTLSLGALLSPVAALAFANSATEEAYVKSYAGRTDIPVPLAVVSPSSIDSTPGVVEVQFVVNEQGKPTQIAVLSTTDEALVSPVKQAIARWKFAPAQRNGTAVPTKVVLPVRFVLPE
jgi:TonB family protein